MGAASRTARLFILITVIASKVAGGKPPTTFIIVGAMVRGTVIITIMSGEWMAIVICHFDMLALEILRHGSYMERVFKDFAIYFEIVEHSPLYIWCYRPL